MQSSTRPRACRPVKLYRAAHEAWFVAFEALPYADLEQSFLELHVGLDRSDEGPVSRVALFASVPLEDDR